MCCRARHLAGFPGIQGIAEPGICGQAPLLSWGWAEGGCQQGHGTPPTLSGSRSCPGLICSVLLSVSMGCSSSPDRCWTRLHRCPAELPGRESPPLAAWLWRSGGGDGGLPVSWGVV